MRTLLFVLVSASLSCGPSLAEPTAREVLSEKVPGVTSAELKLWLEGMQNGLSWANAALGADGKERLYCQPGKLVLTVSQTLSILERTVEKEPKFADLAVGAVLVTALRDTFPC